MNFSSLERTAQDPTEKPTEQQVNRACEPCRLLKVRCLPDETSPSVICQRCKKAGRICIYAAPQKRRQRIRTDTRVAELEREIRAMRSLLTGGEEPIAENRRREKEPTTVVVAQDETNIVDIETSTSLSGGDERSSGDGNNLSRQSSTPMSQSLSPDDGAGTRSGNMPSIITETHCGKDFGLLSPSVSDQLFRSYVTDLVQHYPAVIFPRNTYPEWIRKSKPVLFQAVVTAAACQLDPELFGQLFKKMTLLYAERIFINGEKSLELIQSMLLTSVWYCPPEENCAPAKLHFYQYIHMAATMALDLGIGLGVDKSRVTLEECRCLLACYLNCAGIAMRMRRPNMLQWSKDMGECLEVLEGSHESTLLDKTLAAWVRLQNIVDDWSKNISLMNTHVELSLKGFERQLKKWKEAAGPGVINTSLALAYHQDSIYLYESALESGSTTLIDFNHRHFELSSRNHLSAAQEKTQPPLTAGYINAVMCCINSSQALLDEFFNIEVKSLQVVPIVHFVRASYAIVVLVKLFIRTSMPSSELGKVLDRQILKVDYYIQTLLDKLEEAAGPTKLRVPTKWLTIGQQISAWYHRHLMSYGRGQEYHEEELNSHQTSCFPCGNGFEPNSINLSKHSNPQHPQSSNSFSTAPPLIIHAATSYSHTAIPPSSTAAAPHSAAWSSTTTTFLPTVTNASPPTDDPQPNVDSPSHQLLDLAPMDFSQSDLSFLGIPEGGLTSGGAYGNWPMGDEDMSLFADLGFETGSGGGGGGSGDWDFEL